MKKVYRMDKLTIYARCNNTKLYYVCPVTRVIKPLFRNRQSLSDYVPANQPA